MDLDCLQQGEANPKIDPEQYFMYQNHSPTEDPNTRLILRACGNGSQKCVTSLLTTQNFAAKRSLPTPPLASVPAVLSLLPLSSPDLSVERPCWNLEGSWASYTHRRTATACRSWSSPTPRLGRRRCWARARCPPCVPASPAGSRTKRCRHRGREGTDAQNGVLCLSCWRWKIMDLLPIYYAALKLVFWVFFCLSLLKIALFANSESEP